MKLRLLALFAALVVPLLRGEVVPPPGASPRVLYGIERLRAALPADAPRIVFGRSAIPAAPESFAIITGGDGVVTILGADDSGLLYGSLELANLVHRAGAFPSEPLHLSESPAMVLRGP